MFHRAALVLMVVSFAIQVAAQTPPGLPGAPAAPTLAAEPPALPTLPDLREQSFQPPGASIRLTPREEPGWFRIGVPDGWQLIADRASGRIALTAQDQRGLLLWMLLVPRTLQPQEAASLAASVSAKIAPRAQWTKPAVAARGERITVTAGGLDGDFTHAAGLSVVNADRVAVVLYTLAWAPKAAFAANRDLFAAVLESFAPAGSQAPGGPATAGLEFQRFTDPAEGAFWLDVPKGWTARGGVARKSAVDVRSVIQVVNPEQSILIQAGDTDIPPFLEPWGMLREGQYNGPMLVRRYVPGADFARDYVLWRLKPAIPDLAIEAARPIPKLQAMVQAVYDAYAFPGIERRVDIGEALFRGTWNGRVSRGHVYAATTRIAVQGGTATWFTGDIASLGGFVAAEDQVETAVAVANRMRESFEINPQWFSTQQRTTAEVSRITSETHRYISNLISETYASRQRSYDRIFERYSRYQRGVEPMIDPVTQQRYEVQTGSNYYWIDPRGVIVGTNTHFNPDPNWFREMLRAAP